MRIELEEGGLTAYRLRNQPQKTNDRQYNDFFARKKKKREEEQYRKSLEFYKDNTVSLDDTEIKLNTDIDLGYNKYSIKIPNVRYFYANKKDNKQSNKQNNKQDNINFLQNAINFYQGKYKLGGRHELEDGGKRRIFTEADKDRRAYYRDTEGYINRLAKMYPEISEVEEYEYNEEESPREYYKRMIDELPENSIYDKLIDYNIEKNNNDRLYHIYKGDTFIIKSDNEKVNTLKVDKNFADSLMYNAGKYNSLRKDTIPLNVVVGIPFRETTFGNVRYNNKYNSNKYKYLPLDPATAMSNWHHVNSIVDLASELQKEQPNISRKTALNLLKRAKSLTSVNPYFDTWDYYKKGMYNTGHKKQFGIKYEDAVEKEGNDILNSNEFNKYMNEQGWKQYMKGKKGK